MTDTLQDIKLLQLKLWLEKPLGERLRQFLVDNDALLKGINKAKVELKAAEMQSPVGSPQSSVTDLWPEQ